MHDQADKLREIVHRQGRGPLRPANAPQLIGVTSGSTGAGTTTVAVNLAVGYALAGRRTVLVDFNLERPGIAAGCRLDTRYCVADVLAGRRSLHEVLERGPGGIQVVTGPSKPLPGFDAAGDTLRGVLAELSQLGAHADIVMLDIGSSVSRAVQTFWQAADWLLVVSTPEMESLFDTYALIKLFAESRGDQPVATLMNRASTADVAREANERLTRTCRGQLGLRVASVGWLPCDAQQSAARGGWPIRLEAADSALAREIDRVIERWQLNPAEAAASNVDSTAAPTVAAGGNSPAATVPAPHLGSAGSLGSATLPGASVSQ